MSAKQVAVLWLISCGFFGCCDTRAADQSEQKMMIVAAFGTSLTNGAGWLQPLQVQLAHCLGRQVTVLDFGRSGATSEWGVATVGEVIRSQPDVVLIEFSANDAAWFKGLSLPRSRENTTKIIQAIRRARPQAKIFLMAMSSRPLVRADGFGMVSKPITICTNWLPMNSELHLSTIGKVGGASRRTRSERGFPMARTRCPNWHPGLLVPTIARAIGGATCGTDPIDGENSAVVDISLIPACRHHTLGRRCSNVKRERLRIRRCLQGPAGLASIFRSQARRR